MMLIKYRAKDKRNGVWVFGDLVDNENHERGVISSDGEFHHVDFETLGEYTGRIDNFGEQIYEGDVVLIDGNVQEVYSVEMWLFGLTLMHFDTDGYIDTIAGLDAFNSERLTVIDNVIDKKEREKWQ